VVLPLKASQTMSQLNSPPARLARRRRRRPPFLSAAAFLDHTKVVPAQKQIMSYFLTKLVPGPHFGTGKQICHIQY